MSLNPISEPTGVYPESEFERSLAPLIERALHGCRAVVVPKFGLDIAVFLEDVGPPQPLFVEVKSYGGKRQGGVGFGNGRGEGPQVDLLVGDASALFDSYIRWAFVDATQPVGTDRYAFSQRFLQRMRDKLGLVSAYHHLSGEAHGEETRASYYHGKKEAHPFHLDYCFVPEAWVDRLTGVEVGSFADWPQSDHRPLTVDIDDE